MLPRLGTNRGPRHPGPITVDTADQGLADRPAIPYDTGSRHLCKYLSGFPKYPAGISSVVQTDADALLCADVRIVQVESEDWQPMAMGRPWSSSCCLVFEMLQKSIDEFFSFVPHAPAAQDFCIILLQQCCACVKHYTDVVRQGILEDVSRPQPQRERVATFTRMLEAQHSVGSDAGSDNAGARVGGPSSPGDGGSPADGSHTPPGPRLEQQTITILHNLSEVKGQFFDRMWRHFAGCWGKWQKKTFSNGRGEEPEVQRRREAAARAVDGMYTASEQVMDKKHTKRCHLY